MDVISSLLTDKGSINNSKVVKLLQLVFLLIISKWIYERQFGDFNPINFTDINQLLNSFLGPEFIAVVISFSLAIFIFIAIRLIVIMLYIIFFVPKAKTTLVKKSSFATWSDLEKNIESSQLHVLSLVPAKFLPIASSLGAFSKENEKIVFDDDIGNSIKTYLDDPLVIIKRGSKFFEFYVQFAFSFYIAAANINFPLWSYYLIPIIGLFAFVLLLIAMRDFATLHILIPSLKKMEVLTRTQLKEKDKSSVPAG